MKEIYTSVTKIRRQVFAEVAKLAEHGDYSRIEEIPYKIIPGEIPTYRESVFKERAIVGERLRLALGLPLRAADDPAPISRGIEKCEEVRDVYEPPLINVIPFACDACDTKSFVVSDNCRSCLAHPCMSVCPAKAVSFVDGRSHIDRDKCLRCGRCKDVCPYHAIIQYDRPCAAACGMDAIGSDHLGRAKIDPDKCVACGQCLVNCPFGAISDKSQIFQLVRALRTGRTVIAAIAPAFVGQFGPLATPEKVKDALLKLGFADVYEVAVGADAGAVAEAHHFAHKVATGEERFLATSCCPSWSVMAKKCFPELADYVSKELTPMVATARTIKRDRPEAAIAFIGPCTAKKLEAMRRTVESNVDFVITFEELMGIFAAFDIQFASETESQFVDHVTSAGRGYAVAGGVANAITSCVNELYPELEVKVDRAEGLKNCKKMLTLAKAGRREGYLLEGMACPGGCIGGCGTMLQPAKAQAQVDKFAAAAKRKTPTQNDGRRGE